ncbi:hypothetical protein PanWU01x14_032150 [Parasponia andersonii]|uniref:Uncharacterized protein n=1 Tax=Parasponia andersonii TaxID=3476 RepID=A0A2P5DUC9_PARAD|nr:hypothetical protein PanWU01x14_032150 [Parasponia andersonii]
MNIPMLQMDMPRPYSLLQTETKELWELVQFFQAPLHLPNQILILGTQVIVDTITEYCRQPSANPRRLVVRQSDASQEPHLPPKLLHARVEQMRVEVRRRIEPLNAQFAKVIQRRSEAVLDIREENPGATEKETAGLLRRGGDVGGEEFEDGFDCGGVEFGGEELGAEEGEPGEIGAGEAFGLEEVDGSKDPVDLVGERKLVGVGVRVENAEGFEVAEVFAVGCTELDEAMRVKRWRWRWRGRGYYVWFGGTGEIKRGIEGESERVELHSFLAGNVTNSLIVKF